MHKVRVLIADDHTIVSEGIKSVIKEKSEFEVVGIAVNGREAVDLTASLTPDIIIMDISMPELNGIEATKLIKQNFPDCKIVIYTMSSERQFVIDLFRAGVSAYVLKDQPISDLLMGLQSILSGGTYFSAQIQPTLLRYVDDLENKVVSNNPTESLSRREMEVYLLLIEGKSIREIAESLFISHKTVESHKYNIMQKLQTHSIVDLIKLGIKHQLIIL